MHGFHPDQHLLFFVFFSVKCYQKEPELILIYKDTYGHVLNRYLYKVIYLSGFLISSVTKLSVSQPE